ncbi:MAG: V-type ATP synthase subunit I [Peptoniphilaceae bacterium]|jgi:V/A-type H+-transporting ATPase subunit I|nr:V-type ATP synthase subunit I [Bacillota bacterium]
MAIENMSRFQLYIFDKDRKPLLKRLQKFADVHFVDVRRNAKDDDVLPAPDVSLEWQQNNEVISKVQWMLQLLEPYKEKPGMIQGLKEGLPQASLEQLYDLQESYPWEELYQYLQSAHQTGEDKKNQIANRKQEMEELQPVRATDIPLEALGEHRMTITQWGTIQSKQLEAFEEQTKDEPYLVLEKIAEDGQTLYWQASFLKEDRHRQEDLLRKAGFQPMQVQGEGTPADRIRVLEEEIRQLENDREEARNRIKSKLKELPELHAYFEALQNRKLRLETQGKFGQTAYTTSIEGYVPTVEIDRFKKAVEDVSGQAYVADFTDAERDNAEVPIRLKNNSLVSPFESLTEMYAMPHYNEIDPTPLFAPFYWLFFGMMGADIGYGIILLAITFVALKFFNLTEGMRRFVKFFFYLSFAVIGWGVIYGSFLGGLVAMPALIDMNKDFMVMLILSVALGLVHLFFAMAIKAYMSVRDGNPMDAFYDVGLWYMALVGAILWLLGSFLPLPAIVGKIAMVVMIIGMVGIVLFGARDSESIVGRLVGGLYELYGISSYIGDFVSYTRLMALGLSSAFIGYAANLIVGMLFQAGIIGYILGFVVFLGFHFFNVFLTMLSGYVHTARLTYVEFFGKFYEGGGVPFKKFVHPPKYIEYKTQEVTKS